MSSNVVSLLFVSYIVNSDVMAAASMHDEKPGPEAPVEPAAFACR